MKRHRSLTDYALALILLLPAMCPKLRAQAPPAPDGVYAILPAAALYLSSHSTAALVTPDSVRYVLQNADSALLVWRDTTFLGSLTEFSDALGDPDADPILIAGPFRVVTIVRRQDGDGFGMLVGIVYAP